MAWTFYTNGSEKTSLSTVPNNAVRAKTAVAQSIPNNSFTTIAFELEDYDYGDLHSNVTNNSRLTAQADGVYLIQGTVNWTSNTSNDRGALIRLNGTTTIATSMEVTQSTSATVKNTHVMTHFYMTTGQYVELQAFQNTGGALTLSTTTNSSFSMALVSPLSGGGGGGGGGATNLNGLTDVDTGAAVDGSLFRYEAGTTEWLPTTASNLLLNDAGRLQVPTDGATAGVQIGSDITMARTSANILTMGAANKVQQTTVATAADDLTNQVYVDRINFFMM